MDYEKIGNFIAKRRKSKQLTQKELADRLSLTDRAISRWERGLGCPDISLLESLSEILGVSILELLHGEELNNNENEVVMNILKTKNKTIKIWKIVSLLFVNLVLIGLIFLICVLFVIPIYNSKNNILSYSVVTPSMQPTLNIFDEVFFKKIDISEVKENDIILFESLENGNLITHRVTRIVNLKDGIGLVTRGDNNYEHDTEYVTEKNYLGRMIYKIPFLGKYSLNEEKSNITNIIFLLCLVLGIMGALFIDYIQIRQVLVKGV